MTASTSVHSNALNFMSCLKSGVDPRTGLYNISITLPEVLSNDLRGPGLGLDLSYNPLNTVDSGYGFGWNLALSQFDIGTQIVSLSTGETFKVTCSTGDRLLMKEQKLDTFHFYQQSATHYRVMHKSGLVEILEERGSVGNKVAVPIRIQAPSGHGISLEYEPFNGVTQRLKWVKDDQDEMVLAINREPTGSIVEILLHPFAGVDGGPLARFLMMLGPEKRVTQIILPTENNASWRFDYGIGQNDQLFIREVQTPTGGREEVYYHDSGHLFPVASGRPPLPRVTRHLTYPGFEQPSVDVRYTYKDNQNREHNFLGAGLTITWDDDGLDNLYKYLYEYDYACTESLWVDDQAVRSVQRIFNRFHLQTLETSVQNNNRKIVETTYNIHPNRSYDQQPNDCQMPRQINTQWSVLDNATRQRSETVSNTYDSHGNLLTHTRADGIVETSTWYTAADTDGCPPDPEGFVRHLKDKTVTPAPSAQAGAPVLCTRYRYGALPPLSSSQLSDWIVPESETLVELYAGTERTLQRIQIEHFDLPDEPFLHGRNATRTQTLNDRSTITTWAYSKLLSPQLDVMVQQSSETLTTDFDSVVKTVVHQHSVFSGQELLVQAEGVETRYAYDALNRLVRETVAPGTEFEASRQYQYTLSSTFGGQAEQILINARGASTRTVLDGLGRAVFEERDQVDSSMPARFRQTYAARHDAWNNLEQETVYDWLENQPLALTRVFDYDDWGQQSCVTAADGVQSHTDFDPIGNEDFKGPIQCSWIQAAGIISGRSETWLNPFNKPDRSMSLDAAEHILGAQTFLYDGLGRCTEQRDELQHKTQFSYDAWSRMISSTLPDSSRIARAYAPHSSAELPVALNVVKPDGVTGTLAGEQVFDGLERLTEVRVGPRIEHFAYDGDRMQVKSRTTAAGVSIEFGYNLALTDQPVSSLAPDENAEFTYDHTSARLTKARNEQGLRTYDYDTLNRLHSESWSDAQGKTWQTLYATSLQGRQLKRTELKQETDAGLDTFYHYDTVGRLEGIDQGQLQSSFTYNALSQVTRITTRDLAAATTLLTDLAYDDQGREVLRTMNLGQHPARSIEQVWQIDGLLQSRHLQQGALSLLKETFSYDGRGRLTRHDCSGVTLPRDTEGRAITRQLFSFDALDNLTQRMTSFASGVQNERAQFHYADDAPCQLAGITYTPARAAPNPTFTYDLNGNQLNDERGQRLSYDSQSRLLAVDTAGGQTASQYRYDSHDHLVTSRQGNDSEILRFYQDQQLSSSVQDDRQQQYLYFATQPLGQQTLNDPAQTLLLLTDANASVVGEGQQNALRTAVYSAYGERHSDDDLLSGLGFNGEVREADSGWYLLGKGYRAYNPGLMRFHSPDSLSPFGAGGVNPYTYCLGNPIALRDPTGHDASNQSGRLRRPDEDELPASSGGGGLGLEGWVGIGVGVLFTAISIAVTVASFGTSLPVTGPMTVLGVSTTTTAVAAVAQTAAVIGTVLGTVSTGMQIYSAFSEDYQIGSIASWIGYASVPFILGSGYLQFALQGAAMGAAKAAEAGTKAGVNSARASVSSAAGSVVDDAFAGSIRAVNFVDDAAGASNNLANMAPTEASTGLRASLKAQPPLINTSRAQPSNLALLQSLRSGQTKFTASESFLTRGTRRTIAALNSLPNKIKMARI